VRLVPAANKEIALYAKHVIQSLEEFEDYHRKFVAAQALAGIKPNGEAEATFYATIQDMKEHLLSTLEWTIEDLQHKGDKNYTKHFKDGVS
jgi:hypothetical protein